MVLLLFQLRCFFFSCLIALAKTSSTILKKRGKGKKNPTKIKNKKLTNFLGLNLNLQQNDRSGRPWLTLVLTSRLWMVTGFICSTSVSISYRRCNTSPQTEECKTTWVYSVTVLEARSLKWVLSGKTKGLAGLYSFRRLLGLYVFFGFWLLPCMSQASASFITSSLTLTCLLPSLRTRVITWGPPRFSRIMSAYPVLNRICSVSLAI